ncbi:hypothetical protein FQZ97_1054970 [compost metagenome]
MGAFTDAYSDHLLNLVELRLTGERAHLRVLRQGVADFVFFSHFTGQARRFVMPLGRHQHACRRLAGLAAVEQTGQCPGTHGLRELLVGEDDIG